MDVINLGIVIRTILSSRSVSDYIFSVLCRICWSLEEEAATTHHCAVARHQLRIRSLVRSGRETLPAAAAAVAVAQTDDGGGGGQSDNRVASSFTGPGQTAVRKRTIPR